VRLQTFEQRRRGHDQLRATVGDDALQMLDSTVWALRLRRMHRHGNGTQLQHAEECLDECKTIGIHEYDATAGTDAVGEYSGNAPRVEVQLRIAQHCRITLTIAQKRAVRLRAELARMPFQELGQCMYPGNARRFGFHLSACMFEGTFRDSD
jgi:hypothetical protein